MISSIQTYTSKAATGMEKGSQRVAEGVVPAQRAGESMYRISESSSDVVYAVSDISSVLREQK